MKFPGVIWNFSQPISDNMEEAVSGVKGELAVKLYGDHLRTLEQKAEEIQAQMATVPVRLRVQFTELLTNRAGSEIDVSVLDRKSDDFDTLQVPCSDPGFFRES